MGVRGGWEAEGGQNHPKSSTVCSVRHRNSHSQPGRRRWSLAAVTQHVALLVPLSGSIDPVVDRRGFTGSAKDRL